MQRKYYPSNGGRKSYPSQRVFIIQKVKSIEYLAGLMSPKVDRRTRFN